MPKGLAPQAADMVQKPRDTPETEEMSVGKRLKKARADFGRKRGKKLTQVELAQIARVDQSVIGKLEAERIATSVYIPQLARALGVSATWLAIGQGSMLDHPNGGPSHLSPVTLPGDTKPQASAASADVLDGGFVVMPTAVVVRDGENLAWERDWERAEMMPASEIVKLGVDQDRGVFVPVSGDAMERTLFAGDHVLVDAGDTSIQHGKVYAFLWDDELIVRRLFKAPGGVVIRHDNEARYSDITMTVEQWGAHVQMVGRVIYKIGPGGF